jgi:hypothetical protein
VPLPLPLAPAVTVIHVTLLAAVQVHPAVVVTPTLAVSPPAGAGFEVADSV